MGMGEPADNADVVVTAVRCMTDPKRLMLSHHRVTVSTVAPSPSAFLSLSRAPCALAWSVHASEDDLRREIIRGPTTEWTMAELRDGFVAALNAMPVRNRVAMLEVALMDRVNDRPGDAESLARFAQGIKDRVPKLKLMVNLIPFNNVEGSGYSKPDDSAVVEFQKILRERGVFTFVRTTRGDDESAACGQLTTKRHRRHESEYS